MPPNVGAVEYRALASTNPQQNLHKAPTLKS